MKYMLIWLCFLLFLSCSSQQSYREAPLAGPDVAVEVEALTPYVPVFFTYRHQGKKINFFVMRTDGKVLSFLDACMSCYAAKKGYRFDEGRIVCRDCNVGYPVSEIEKGVGGCFPIRINGTLSGGKYLIPVSALERTADKF
jgi:uncharacterized membrane protein